MAKYCTIFEAAQLLEVAPQTVTNISKRLQWQVKYTSSKHKLFLLEDVFREAKRRIGEKARLQSMGLKYSSENKNKENKVIIRKKRKEKGLCQVCGKSKEQPSKSACDNCLERTKEYGKTEKARLIHEQARKRRNSTPKGILVRIKRSAKSRGLEFNLTEDDIIIPAYCPLLGIPITFNNSNGSKEKHGSASVDRIDNSKGYIKGNVWVISHLANMMKQDATIEELKTFAKSVLKHFGE